ncbi:DUF3693 domain-containing protein [Undibacterium sp. Ren11W]|uniref:DUF3693 domain-containing protein n=1 Tax=Undibacterium sp. Ren11W TaxID=3413045 RepID=UPI003BF1915D
MNTMDYLKQAKICLGIESDYALAKEIGMSRSNISSLTNGKTTMGDATALSIAKIIKKEPAIVLAEMHAEREKDPALKAVWLSVMEKFSTGFKTLTLCSTPRPA